MQPGHRKHYAKFRLRCIKERCALVFCGGCGARPYHEGYTCDEWRRREEGLSCRLSHALFHRVFFFLLRIVAGFAMQKFAVTSKKSARGLSAPTKIASSTRLKAALQVCPAVTHAAALSARTSGSSARVFSTWFGVFLANMSLITKSEMAPVV